MNIVDKATQYVALKYEGKHRTAMQIPYATHLFGVARILKSNGYNDTVVAAGLLHDILEDELVAEQELLSQFDEEIVALVKSLTEMPKTYSWQIRKEDVIARVKERSSDEMAILLAEKIHNIKSIYTEMLQFGDNIWNNFNAPKESQEWYYRSILDETKIYHPTATLVLPFEQAIDKLFGKVQLL
ncbi:HD domain-containing protein [Solibacillus silvestris]|uniref:HD domain-containing protein n=1 Tax=Solibacillus silvestris TaxID=76853 RepID=UPI003F80C442